MKQQADHPPLVSLEICRGQTRHPRRPIDRERFLIGSGAECDLQLGEAGIATLHSVILSRGGEVWIDCLAPRPPLLVNGQSAQSVRLRNGDVIELGPFRFVLHVQPSVGTAPMPAKAAPRDIPLEKSLEELSASELADLIEQEQAFVDRHERGRRVGIEALLEAVLNNAQSTPASRKSTDGAAGDEVRDLDKMLRDLNGFSDELRRRSRRLAAREATYAEAADRLLDAQDTLSKQLDAMLRQIEAADNDDNQSMRASA